MSWKKASIVLVLLVLVFTAACSGNSSTGNNQGNNSQGNDSDPVTVTMFHTDNNAPIPTEETPDIPSFQYIQEQTNTKLDVTYLPHTRQTDQLRIKISGGEIPDVMQGGRISSMAAITGGEIEIPLNDLIEEHGPNLQKVVTQSAWDAVTRNGKIYAIPMNNTPGSGHVLYVRQDWLDNVGISELPETSEEFLDMLRAFRDKDANGNGDADDEIPFSMRENLTWGNPIFGMFGMALEGYHVIDGEVIPDIINPDMKKALAYVRTMVEEGLMDSEFLTNKQNVWLQKIFNDTVGSYSHLPRTIWSDWQSRFNETVPGAKVRVIQTPRAPGYDGPVGTLENPTARTYFVTKEAEDPAAVVRLLDWFASEEGQAFTNLGIPGETYTKEGDKYIYDSEKDNEQQTAQWRYLAMPHDTTEPEVQKALLGEEVYEIKKAALEVAANEGISDPFYAMPVMPAHEANPDLKHSGNLFQEAAAKILLGHEPLDYFDQFVETWRSQGGEQFIKEATEWYNNNYN